jgi:microcystin-dependent protein
MTLAGFTSQQGATPEVLMWPGHPDDVPSGWLICDGNNGTPDLRNRFLRGTESMGDTAGTKRGKNSRTMSAAEMPNHNHPASNIGIGDHQHKFDISGGLESEDPWSYSYVGPGGGNRSTSTSGGHSHSLQVDNTGAGAAIDNRPRSITVTYIMKA